MVSDKTAHRRFSGRCNPHAVRCFATTAAKQSGDQVDEFSIQIQLLFLGFRFDPGKLLSGCNHRDCLRHTYFKHGLTLIKMHTPFNLAFPSFLVPTSFQPAHLEDF